jgi:hypothetical protein
MLPSPHATAHVHTPSFTPSTSTAAVTSLWSPFYRRSSGTLQLPNSPHLAHAPSSRALLLPPLPDGTRRTASLLGSTTDLQSQAAAPPLTHVTFGANGSQRSSIDQQATASAHFADTKIGTSSTTQAKAAAAASAGGASDSTFWWLGCLPFPRDALRDKGPDPRVVCWITAVGNPITTSRCVATCRLPHKRGQFESIQIQSQVLIKPKH